MLALVGLLCATAIIAIGTGPIGLHQLLARQQESELDRELRRDLFEREMEARRNTAATDTRFKLAELQRDAINDYIRNQGIAALTKVRLQDADLGGMMNQRAREYFGGGTTPEGAPMDENAMMEQMRQVLARLQVHSQTQTQ